MAHHPALIVGAGPIGLACGIAARRHGVDALLVDQGALCESIVRYPVGMVFFTTPERLEIGGHPLATAGAKATREEALSYYRGVARAEHLAVRTRTRLTGARREGDRWVCDLATARGPETVTTDRLVLATGYFDHPNLLDVPGEDLPHVSHYFDEAHRTFGQDVVIIGGKNSAIEAALQCFRAGARVTVVYRRTALKPTVKYWLKPDFENRVKAGEITARFGAEVAAITPEDVVITDTTGTRRVRADRVYALTGFHADLSLLQGLGVALEGAERRPRHDPDTLETNVPGLYLAGSLTAGMKTSEVFIENGRFDGEKIFGDAASRAAAQTKYLHQAREIGE